MAPGLRLICHDVSLCFLSFALLAQVPDAQSELRLGIEAYKDAAYNDAIEHLERAVARDPTSVDAHLHLADAYNERYCETCEFDSSQSSSSNDHWRELAIAEYKKVLKLNASNAQALNSLAHGYYWQADLDEAERYYRKTIDVNPRNVEALYTLAVIDWQRSNRLRMQKRIELQLDEKQPLIGLPACSGMRADNLARIDESIVLMTRTLQALNAREPMAYMAIFYRERADIQCGDRASYEDDLRTSARWHERACKTRHNPDSTSIPLRWPASPPPLENDASCPF